MGREDLADIFGWNDFRLFGLLVEDRVRQGFTFVEDGHILLGIQANGDNRLAQRISRTPGLDLVDHLFELDRQVFAEGASFLPSQNTSEIVFGGEWTMRIYRTSGIDGKALVEILHELRQIRVASLPVGNAAQTHLFDQAVLQGLIDSLDAAFGLGRVGADDLDVQFLHGSSKLRQGVTGACGG